MIKGRPRFNIEVPAGTDAAEVERVALSHEGAAKWLEGATPKKVIVVPNKLVNVVL
jgi:leucyl-tRNA synthetase